MDNDNARTVLDFYIKANANKEKTVNDIHCIRPYSIAEEVVLSSIDTLLIDEDDAVDRIRYYFLNSLQGKYDGLKKAPEFDKVLYDYILIPNPVYFERGLFRIFNMYPESDRVYNNYLTLRNKIRQGHIYWGAKGERLESILEHIYGCIVILLGLESEYGYKLDYDKIIKMLLLHETEEIIIGDLTEWDISPEEKARRGREAVLSLLDNLPNKKELINLIDEFNGKNTLESEYANLIDKLEYDMQVKVYELEGRYDFEHYPLNVVTRSKSVQDIINNGAKSVFDVHYEYDKKRYAPVPCLRRILEEAKNY